MKTRSRKSAITAIASKPYWRMDDAEVLVQALGDSGLPFSRFCQQYKISSKRLRRWQQRLEAQQMAFHPVEVLFDGGEGPSVEAGDGGVELVLHGGRRIAIHRGFDASLLEEVVRVVESWKC